MYFSRVDAKRRTLASLVPPSVPGTRYVSRFGPKVPHFSRYYLILPPVL